MFREGMAEELIRVVRGGEAGVTLEARTIRLSSAFLLSWGGLVSLTNEHPQRVFATPEGRRAARTAERELQG